MDDARKVYTEKALEMANDYPLMFGAWLVLETVAGTAMGLQEKISARLQEADRRAMAAVKL